MLQIVASSCVKPHAGIADILMPCLMIQNCCATDVASTSPNALAFGELRCRRIQALPKLVVLQSGREVATRTHFRIFVGAFRDQFWRIEIRHLDAFRPDRDRPLPRRLRKPMHQRAMRLIGRNVEGAAIHIPERKQRRCGQREHNRHSVFIIDSLSTALVVSVHVHSGHGVPSMSAAYTARRDKPTKVIHNPLPQDRIMVWQRTPRIRISSDA